MPSNTRNVLVAVVSVSLLAGGANVLARRNPARVDVARTAARTADAPPPLATIRRGRAPSAYEQAVTLVDRDIDFHARRAGERRDAWLDWELVAKAHLDRAKLTGDYADYRRAGDAIARAFAAAPQGAGPLLTRAQYNFTLHRLAQVEQDLAAAERLPAYAASVRATVISLRADVAFHEGRYDDARRGYETMLAAGRTFSALVAMANYRWHTGDFDGASALIDEAERTLHGDGGQQHAFVHLVRGLMDLDRGRYDSALAHFRRGTERMPGWWLLEEHVAEAVTLQGRDALSEVMYQDLVARTRNPEFMDALASIYRERGDEARARRWIAEARAQYDARLAEFPEATYGHALDHFLELEPDPARAVELAERNRDARPGGEAYTKLAQAYLRAGRVADARAAIERVLATAWDTAETHATAARVFAAAGDPRAASERARALATNPHALEALDWLEPAAAPRGGVAAR